MGQGGIPPSALVILVEARLTTVSLEGYVPDITRGNDIHVARVRGRILTDVL